MTNSCVYTCINLLPYTYRIFWKLATLKLCLQHYRKPCAKTLLFEMIMKKLWSNKYDLIPLSIILTLTDLSLYITITFHNKIPAWSPYNQILEKTQHIIRMIKCSPFGKIKSTWISSSNFIFWLKTPWVSYFSIHVLIVHVYWFDNPSSFVPTMNI